MTRRLVAVVVILVIVVAARYALRGLQLEQIAHLLRGARPLPIAAGALAALMLQVSRAAFWRLAMRQQAPIPLRRFVRYTIVGNAASALLPARAGEAVRVWLLVDLERVAVIDAVGAALAERALDLVSMVLVLSPLLLLLASVPVWVTRAGVGLFVAAIAIVIAVHTIARRADRAEGLLGKLGRALSSLASWPRFLLGLLVLTVGWLFDVAALVLVGYALGLPLPPAAPLLVLLSVNLAIAVPAAPAQLGSHEAGTMIALALLGIDKEPALAFALVYHAVHVLPLLLAAALDAPLLVRALAGTRRTPAAS